MRYASTLLLLTFMTCFIGYRVVWESYAVRKEKSLFYEAGRIIDKIRPTVLAYAILVLLSVPLALIAHTHFLPQRGFTASFSFGFCVSTTLASLQGSYQLWFMGAAKAIGLRLAVIAQSILALGAGLLLSAHFLTVEFWAESQKSPANISVWLAIYLAAAVLILLTSVSLPAIFAFQLSGEKVAKQVPSEPDEPDELPNGAMQLLRWTLYLVLICAAAIPLATFDVWKKLPAVPKIEEPPTQIALLVVLVTFGFASLLGRFEIRWPSLSVPRAFSFGNLFRRNDRGKGGSIMLGLGTFSIPIDDKPGVGHDIEVAAVRSTGILVIVATAITTSLVTTVAVAYQAKYDFTTSLILAAVTTATSVMIWNFLPTVEANIPSWLRSLVSLFLLMMVVLLFVACVSGDMSTLRLVLIGNVISNLPPLLVAWKSWARKRTNP